MKVHLDFESRSEVDIWASGAWIYSTHPSTKVLCLVYAVDDAKPVLLNSFPQPSNVNRGQWQELHYLANKSDVLFCAHNAFFEQCMWQHHFVPRGFPVIPIKRWRCTVAKANAYSLPASLEKAALALRLTQQKDKQGRAVMLKLCKPRSAKVTEDPSKVYWNEDPQEFESLYKYCIQDVETERELDKRLPELLPQEQELWFIDQIINFRGVRINRDFAKRAVNLLDHHQKTLNKELEVLSGGKVTAGTQVAGMLKYLSELGCHLPDLQKKTVADAVKGGMFTPNAIEVLRYRKELGKSSTAKYQRMIEASDDDGVVRDNYVFHAAGTGRWGGKLVQMQNLYKGRADIDPEEVIRDIDLMDYPTIRMCYTDFSETFASCLRASFIAREGKTFNIVDYSAIEARVAFWLSECALGLQEFKLADEGKDVEIYVKMARRIFQKDSLTKQNKKERTLGKQAILGCGYGIGGKKFKMTCDSYGIEVSDYEAQALVNLYRTTYVAGKTYWYPI